jgi:hypothetical protein
MNFGLENDEKMMTKMFGVVLWGDSAEKKAVFWCEDHGDLAYYDGSDDDTDTPLDLAAGDMVQFDVCLENKIRRARNATLVRQKLCNGLQEDLRKSAAGLRPNVQLQSNADGMEMNSTVVSLVRPA